MVSGRGCSCSSGVAWVAEGKAEDASAFFKIRRAIWLRMKLLEEKGARRQTGAFLTMLLEQVNPTIPKTK